LKETGPNYFKEIDRDNISALKITDFIHIERQTNEDGDTLLHYAIKTEKYNIVDTFFEKWGNCLNIKNNEGKTVRNLLQEKKNEHYIKKINVFTDNYVHYAINLINEAEGDRKYLIETNSNSVYVEKKDNSIKTIKKIKDNEELLEIKENIAVKKIFIEKDYIENDTLGQLEKEIQIPFKGPKITFKEENVVSGIKFFDVQKLNNISKNKYSIIEKVIAEEKKAISEIKEWIQYEIKDIKQERKKEMIIAQMVPDALIGEERYEFNRENIMMNYVLGDCEDEIIDIAFTFELSKNEYIKFLDMQPDKFTDKLNEIIEKLDNGDEITREEFFNICNDNIEDNNLENEIVIEEKNHDLNIDNEETQIMMNSLSHAYKATEMKEIIIEKFKNETIPMKTITYLVKEYGIKKEALKDIIRHNIEIEHGIEISDDILEGVIKNFEVVEINEVKGDTKLDKDGRKKEIDSQKYDKVQNGKDIYLVKAIESKEEEIIREALEEGGNINADIYGSTPFLIAIDKLEHTMIIELIEEYGADIFKIEEQGKEALDIAIATGDVNKVIALYYAGAEFNDDNLEIAKEYGHTEIYEFIQFETKNSGENIEKNNYEKN
jgi:hypothetical protein